MGETKVKSRGGRIRTDDFLLPKQALYQAELRPATEEGSVAQRGLCPGSICSVSKEIGAIWNHPRIQSIAEELPVDREAGSRVRRLLPAVAMD